MNMTKGTVREISTPLPCLFSVICFAVFGLAGNGIDAVPGAALVGIEFFLLLFGKLFKGDVFFHGNISFQNRM